LEEQWKHCINTTPQKVNVKLSVLANKLEMKSKNGENAEHDKEDKSNQEEKRKKIDKAMIDINNQVKRHSTGNN